MNKQEFVDRLRMALNGRVSPGLVMDNVNYYQDYINTEIRKGRQGSCSRVPNRSKKIIRSFQPMRPMTN